MKRKLLLLTAFAVCALTGMRAQTDVTSTYLTNASFEFSAEGTNSTATALTNDGNYFGWKLPNLGTKYINLSIGNSNACEGQAFGIPNAKEGIFYYYCRRGWNNLSSTNATLSTTSKTELQAGHYTITVDYKGLDSWDNEHTSKGSYLKIEAKSGDNSLATVQTGDFDQVKGNDAGKDKFKGDENWKSQTLEFDVTSASSVTFNFIHHFVGGVRTDMVLDNVKLTFEPFATTNDYNALSSAITAAEAKTIGFDNGDYAPYNNTEALKKLVEAKAIDQTGNNPQSTVQNLTTDLNQATWTANENEVNAIFDGSFEHDYSAQTGNVQPIGWYREEGHYTGDGYNVRYMKLPDNTNESGYGLFGKFTLNYGKETGYTMPLKKGVYSLDFIYGGWNERGTREIKIFNEKSNAIVIPTTTVTAKDNQAHQTAEAYSNYSGKFIVPEDGDYVISFYRENTSSQNQIVISDIKIFIVPESSVSMSVKAGKYGTFIAPFDVTIPEGVKAYKVNEMEADGKTVKLDEVTATIPANTPVVLENTTGKNFTKDFFGKSTATEDTYTVGLLTGVYNNSAEKPYEIPASTETIVNYVLQTQPAGQAFYKVESDYNMKTPNRAYLTVEGSSNVKAVFFPGQGDATGINAVSTLLGGDVEGIYTVGGAKVNSLQKGLNIIRTADGKTTKVLVK